MGRKLAFLKEMGTPTQTGGPCEAAMVTLVQLLARDRVSCLLSHGWAFSNL